MFKKKFRLDTSAFKEVFDFGKTLRKNHFLIKTKENPFGYSRFAVVISKKIEKSAVGRKYQKRRFMNALKEKKDVLPKADYIFILNSSIKDVQYKDLLQIIDTLNL